MKKCISCNKVVSNNKTEFKCPVCKKELIVRCDHCKATAKAYKCTSCGFEGL